VLPFPIAPSPSPWHHSSCTRDPIPNVMHTVEASNGASNVTLRRTRILEATAIHFYRQSVVFREVPTKPETRELEDRPRASTAPFTDTRLPFHPTSPSIPCFLSIPSRFSHHRQKTYDAITFHDLYLSLLLYRSRPNNDSIVLCPLISSHALKSEFIVSRLSQSSSPASPLPSFCWLPVSCL
jgi:hypothetical protein